ncbi:hypothetical protein [Cedecea sp. NFIX57]|uniref:hypothetical protein n=1 Tax=Cedecea sp. NFIX57 TaxID=1566286 RepID=UPI000A0E4F69|nr:hypothetical protein [Cedecea sp. NFIX57]SMG45148.1 hypothetical protein SAMN03159353_101149 [Cedecea sp. NFIX57]
MAFLGFVSERESQSWADATSWLPSFSFYEKHLSPPIEGTPEAIIQAVLALNMEDDPVIRRLLRLRQLPRRLRRALFKSESAEPADSFGFGSFTLLHQSSHEVSFGLAGRFWRPLLDVESLKDAGAFQRFADLRAAKLVLRFDVRPENDGTAVLRTETFVYCPTPRVKALFALYWGLIRPASGWIRRRTLLGIQRKLAAVLPGSQQ